MAESKPAAAAPVIDLASLPVASRAAHILKSAERRTELAKLAEKHAGITVITNQAGREDCHSALMEMRKVRINIEKDAKAARDDAVKFSKACVEEEKALVGIISGEEARLQKIRDDWDAAEEAKLQEKIRAEQQRARTVQERVADLQTLPSKLVGLSLATIANALKLLAAYPDNWTDGLQPTPAEDDLLHEAYASTLAEVRRMHAAAVAAAEEAARLAAEAKRLDEQKAELERRQAEQRAADEKARLEREEAEAAHRRKMEEEQREARAAQERMQAAVSEIHGIQHQVIIAQAGRFGVRAGGTVECARETLAETEAWPVTEEHFGFMYQSALKAKAEAIASIKAVIVAAEARKAEEDRLAADRRALEEQQRKQREDDERREREARAAEEARQREENRKKEEAEAAARRAKEEAEAAERARQRAEEEKAREAEEVRAEAERKERLRLAMLADGRQLLTTFCVQYGGVPEFEDVAEDIREFLEKEPVTA